MNLLDGAEHRVAVASAVTSIGVLAGSSLTGSVTVIGAAIALCLGLAIVSPLGGVLAVIATLPWFHLPLTVGTLDLALSELLLICTVVGTTVRFGWSILKTRYDVSTASKLVLASLSTRIAVPLGILTITGFWLSVLPYDSTHRSESLREWRWVFAEPLLLVMVLGIVVSGAASRRLVALALIAGVSIASAHAIADVAIGGGVTVEGVTRLSGPFPHPNALALMVTRVGALALVWFILETSYRKVLGVPTAITLVTIVATYSRGAWSGLGVAIVLSAIHLRGWSRRIALGIPAIVVALLAVLARERVFSLFGGGSGTLRLSLWRSALAMIQDRPIVGYGPDQFLYAYLPRYVEPVAWQERFSSHAHNLFLDFWIRLGIIGCAFAVGVVVVCLLSVAGIVRRPFSGDPLTIAATTAIIALVVHGLVDNAYFSHELAMSAWLLAWLAFHPGRESVVEGAREIAGPRLRRRGFHRVPPVRQPSR